MTKNVVKNVWFLEVVHLFFGSNEGTGRKASVGEMIKEHVVRHKSGNRNDMPAGDLAEPITELFHVGNAAVGQRQRLCHRQKFVTRTALQGGLCAPEQA